MSVTDYGIRVLGMPSGQVLHHLKLHTSERPAASTVYLQAYALLLTH